MWPIAPMRRCACRQLLAADPDFAFGQLLRAISPCWLSTAPACRRPAKPWKRRRSSPPASRLASGRISAALAHWIDGDIDATLAAWEQILDEHPLDVMAFRLHHFLAFWYGRPEVMARQADIAHRHWSPELAGWPALLACRCFAHEEVGNYAVAEAAGREAIALAPGDLWAAHGVAHVLEMQGRHEEGIAWLNGLEPHWDGGNNLKHHLWWHRGLYHFERREFARGAGALRPQLPRPRLAAHAGATGHVHRRAERHLHAVPAGAPGRRRRQPVGRAGRQGRGAHRRLPLHLHASALDDGADGGRPLGRSASACCEGMRAFAAAARGHRCTHRARLRAADLRGALGTRQGAIMGAPAN